MSFTALLFNADAPGCPKRMIIGANQGIELPEVDSRCPYVIFRDVLGADCVSGLLEHVVDRQRDFQVGRMHKRQTGETFVDPKVRLSFYLRDLGAFAGPIKAFVAAITGPALSALHLVEPRVEPKEFEITAYPDGGHIGEHIDTKTSGKRVRVLSCVYYFAATPRRFSGGALRLYSLPSFSRKSDEAAALSFVDVQPDTDTLIVFPSWINHQVLPVRVPSGAWVDSRFTINCWVHRASGSPAGNS
jgi:SM-20-related protein